LLLLFVVVCCLLFVVVSFASFSLPGNCFGGLGGKNPGAQEPVLAQPQGVGHIGARARPPAHHYGVPLLHQDPGSSSSLSLDDGDDGGEAGGDGG
jgi:hypothetical protein